MYDLPVYLLDLCIFSYHLHSQALIWPMDPYYEQMVEEEGKPIDKTKRRRYRFMLSVPVQQWPPPVPPQVVPPYQGPSSCMNWPGINNQNLDPIVSRYDRLYPWRPSFTRPKAHNEPWLIYNTPVEITDRINSVYMVRYDGRGANPWPYIPVGGVPPTIVIDPIRTARPDLAGLRESNYQAPPATDVLYCFEGGTGGSETVAPHWSMMGYVLAKEEIIQNQPVYDVFIVFRGSRSGKIRPGQSAIEGTGNPDWVTDMMSAKHVEEDPVISRSGSVCTGFRSSLKTMLPTIVHSLKAIQQARNAPPRYIYVTGHSLGGGLASHFASSMLLGVEYGPNGTGSAMPSTLRLWPWETMRLVTFGGPIVGGETFHHAFNQTLPSLRISLEGDPITQEIRHYPVGLKYEISYSKGISQKAHEPYEIRKQLVTDRYKNGFSIKEVPTEKPWVTKNTFGDVLAYFDDRKNRTNISPISLCLGSGAASNFASEFQTFLRILDPKKTWTDPLINWINDVPSIAPSSTGRARTGWSLPKFPFTELDALPTELADLKTYLAVCLVLCALSNRRSTLSDVKNLFGKEDDFWTKIQEFK